MNLENSNYSSNKNYTFKDIVELCLEIFNILRKKIKLFLITGLICGIIGYLYAHFQKTEYTANLSFVLEEEKTGPAISGSSIANQLGLDFNTTSGGTFSGNNLLELMKSRKIIEKTLLSNVKIKNDSLTIANYYLKVFSNQSNRKTSEISFPLDSDHKALNFKQDSLLQNIYWSIYNNNLSFNQKDKKSSIISVQVKSNDETFSKVFCEKIVEVTSNYYVELRSKKAKNNYDLIKRQVDSVRYELNNANFGLANAIDNVFNLNPAFNKKSVPIKRNQFDVQTNTVILNQLIASMEMAKTTLLKETPLFQIIDAPIYPLEKKKIGRIKTFIFFSIIGVLIYALKIILHFFYKRAMS